MNVDLHYDQLRFARIKNIHDLRVGKKYAVCHVPMDNPYTMGVDPHMSIATVIDVRCWSFNEENGYPKGRGSHVSFSTLDDRVWKFHLERPSTLRSVLRPEDGMYRSWHHATDYGMSAKRDPYNYLLDIEALAAEKVNILPTTSVKFVISPVLEEERRWEASMYH